MALPASFLDELRARTPLAAVVARRVKLARSGRQWKGCCPFHGEKTPSFYVYDDGFHCYGCGAHGDAISFVMQTQGSSFPEAVEQLAAEAGMDVPRPTEQAAQAERRRLDLHGVLDAAGRVYERWLWEPQGNAALAYLRARGLQDDTIRRFGLGWSGPGRGGLLAAVTEAGVTAAMLVEAGLTRPPEDGRAAFDLFFDRVMFPIRDRRGRTISFGGRSLGDRQPKYVNGPETELFSKRRSLFALDRAREPARRGAAVVAVEGYLDVILLHQAGFEGAVAPLGTALTEEQLEALWLLSPAPILCFDGDAAGGRAAARAATTALPHLAPSRSLMLASMPAGEDPDSFVRRRGPAAFQSVLEAARPLSSVLYDLLREGVAAGTPEQRAALRQRLEAAAGAIRDKALASEYRRALLDRFFARPPAPAHRGGAGGRAGYPDRFGRRAIPSSGASLPRPIPALAQSDLERARTLVAILLNHPELLHDVEEAFGELALPPELARLRHAIAGYADSRGTNDGAALDSPGLMNHLTQIGLAAEAAQALSAVSYPLGAYALPSAMPAEAEAGWWHIFGLMHRGRLEEEVAAAMREMAERADATTQRRIVALCTARNALMDADNWGDTGDATDAAS